MKKLLCISLWFNAGMVIISIGLAVLAIFYKELQESVPFLVAISILAITSTHLLGVLTTVVSMKELKELKSKT